jgi:hypothetical protein
VPTFQCDGESSFCIVEFGEKLGTKPGRTVQANWCDLRCEGRKRTGTGTGTVASRLARPLFRLGKNFKMMNSTTFVLFDKYCPIVDQLGSKDSSRDFQLNCVISYFFTYI